MFVTWSPAFVDDSSTIPASFLNMVRVNLGRSIDAVMGSEGLAYAPSTPIIFGGSGLRLESNTVFAAGHTITSDAALEQQGDASFTGETTVTDCVELTMRGPTVLTGAESTTARRSNSAAITDTASVQTHDATIADYFLIPAAHTNNLDIRQATSSPVPPDGYVIRYTRETDSSSGRVARFKSGGGSTIVTLGSGGAGWVELIFRGGAWRYHGSGGASATSITVP